MKILQLFSIVLCSVHLYDNVLKMDDSRPFIFYNSARLPQDTQRMVILSNIILKKNLEFIQSHILRS